MGVNLKMKCKCFPEYIQRILANVGPLYTEMGDHVMSNKELEESLNDYFVSVFLEI